MPTRGIPSLFAGRLSHAASRRTTSTAPRLYTVRHTMALRIEHRPVAIFLADGVAVLRLRGGRLAVLLND
jgi:hypothetical protein